MVFGNNQIVIDLSCSLSATALRAGWRLESVAREILMKYIAYRSSALLTDYFMSQCSRRFGTVAGLEAIINIPVGELTALRDVGLPESIITVFEPSTVFNQRRSVQRRALDIFSGVCLFVCHSFIFVY